MLPKHTAKLDSSKTSHSFPPAKTSPVLPVSPQLPMSTLKPLHLTTLAIFNPSRHRPHETPATILNAIRHASSPPPSSTINEPGTSTLFAPYYKQHISPSVPARPHFPRATRISGPATPDSRHQNEKFATRSSRKINQQMVITPDGKFICVCKTSDEFIR